MVLEWLSWGSPYEMKKAASLNLTIKTDNKRMLSAWFSAALQTIRKCGRYVQIVKGEKSEF